jgi:hypothetical protein
MVGLGLFVRLENRLSMKLIFVAKVKIENLASYFNFNCSEFSCEKVMKPVYSAWGCTESWP